MSTKELGKWLRQQRETRFWSREEMARQLIKAAHAKNDMSVPSVESLAHNIYRWERGTIGATEHYKLSITPRPSVSRSPTSARVIQRSRPAPSRSSPHAIWRSSTW